MKYMCGSCCLPTLIFLTLPFTLKWFLEKKYLKWARFQILSLFSLLNVITKYNNFPTYLPKFCWYATGTTHIFHLGLIKNTFYKSQLNNNFNSHHFVVIVLRFYILFNNFSLISLLFVNPSPCSWAGSTAFNQFLA